MLISDILALAAEQWPDREAVVYVDYGKNIRKAVTYSEFNARVNQTAHALLQRGIKKGDAVLHFMPNRIEWLETYFGIIRIGAKVVPLNFRFTTADLVYAVNVIEPKLAFVDESLVDVLAPAQSDFASIKDYIYVTDEPDARAGNYEEFIKDKPETPPGVNVAMDDILGIYFTSGTTGLPKAIVYPHSSLFYSAVSNGLTLRQPDKPNSIIYCPFYHTATFNFWLPLLFKGGRATILNKFSPFDLLKVFEEEKGTEVNIPMPHCVDLVNAYKYGHLDVSKYDLSSWITINTGSQPYPPSLIVDLQKMFPHVGVQHGFGMSEAGGASLTIVQPEEIITYSNSVGRPNAMVNAAILDEDWNRLPPDTVGELAFKSLRNMREYYNNPEATAATIKDGWLRTGDYAKMDADGYIYIVDRKKDVIISGGENVYPVEVENVLLTHPKIKEVAVIGLPDERWGECVTAVVVLHAEEALTKEDLLAWCKDNFPAYKRPRRIEFGLIPKSHTQKVLKPELRKRYA